jgi:hypothetical protein
MSRTFSTKTWIGGELKAFGAVRLEPEQLEVAADRAFGNPALLSQHAHTPVGGARGLGVQDAIEQFRDPLVAMNAWASGAQFIVQTGQPMFAVTLAPQTDGGPTDRATFGNGLVGKSGGRQQYNVGPLDQRMGHTARTHQRLQLLLFRDCQYHRPIWPAHRASSTL